MVQVLNEVRHSGGFVVMEEIYRSRDQGTYLNTTGADLVVPAGMVLASGAETDATVTPKAGNTGNGTLTGLNFGPGAATGTYVVRYTSSTAFTVTAPNGTSLPGGTVGTPYTDAELNFTSNAGGTAWAAGDAQNILVPPTDMSFVNWTNAAPATAIMYNTAIIAAGATAKVTVLTRHAEVNAAELVFDATIVASTNPSFAALQQTAQQQLRGVGIISR